MSFNKIILVGNLGRDPELRYTPQGDAVCSFSMATTEKRKDKSGEMQSITTWFRITLWGHRGETAAKYLAKGNSVYIEGRLRIEDWTDRDNNKRYSLEVNATDMQFIGTRGEGGGSAGEYSGGGHDDYDTHSDPPQSEPSSASSADSSAAAAPATDDDIPF